MVFSFTKPWMPNVDGKRHAKAHQNDGMLLCGHDTPLKNSRPTDVNTTTNITSSRCGMSMPMVMAKKMHAKR